MGGSRTFIQVAKAHSSSSVVSTDDCKLRPRPSGHKPVAASVKDRDCVSDGCSMLPLMLPAQSALRAALPFFNRAA